MTPENLISVRVRDLGNACRVRVDDFSHAQWLLNHLADKSNFPETVQPQVQAHENYYTFQLACPLNWLEDSLSEMDQVELLLEPE